MAEELQALQAKGLIFLIIFGFFVENHLLANTKSSLYDLQFESYNLCRQQALFFSLCLDSFVENYILANKNPVSMTYGLRVIIIAGNGPYFSHYFQFLC